MNGGILVIIAIAAIFIWLAIRELVTWYLKIDKIVNQMDQNNAYLKGIHDILKEGKQIKDKETIHSPGEKI